MTLLGPAGGKCCGREVVVESCDCSLSDGRRGSGLLSQSGETAGEGSDELSDRGREEVDEPRLS